MTTGHQDICSIRGSHLALAQARGLGRDLPNLTAPERLEGTSIYCRCADGGVDICARCDGG
jgi:hypothetical protein